MSRGDRITATGNLQLSMRDNYAEHGVAKYYKKVGASYRNPHYPGVQKCLFSWYARWWTYEHQRFSSRGPLIFDMACGSGEATIALQEWWSRGLSSHSPVPSAGQPSQTPRQRKEAQFLPDPPLTNYTPLPSVIATDPYTAEAFTARVSLPCDSLSFEDIAQGGLPQESHPLPCLSNPTALLPPTIEKVMESGALSEPIIEMVICSFALHLIESPSELFALLWELSTKCRWLVILAPHKKPEIKDGWGWTKWNITTWSSCPMHDSQGELLYDRVHCRVYRSLSTM